MIIKNNFVVKFSLILCISFSYTKAHANNTSGVTSPIVNPKDQSFQFRTAYTPSENNHREQLVVRMNVQKSILESVRIRLVGQVKDTTGNFEYDALSADLLWQFQHRQDGIWDSAVRFDIKTRKAHRSEGLSFKWSNRWSFADKWSITQVLSFSWNVGGESPATGTYLESRTGIAYTTNKVTLGLDSFNNLGKIGDFGKGNEQSHQIGPSVSGKYQGLSYSISYLRGITNGARDNVFRFFVKKAF
ncbi:hypothetical protein Q4574_04005 [Aliiglaciecola sp. 3_MG-2023]|uniref:hypothetical protein n=1 Tax=Aliiglaciecola sp. 3_MG-2023 TaxID=3062644 RepID=UPI0026E12B3D|nr:hypothetical protein [Aliiglaciecola sp. 3_MG-2023]MDO6692432.1 hypothetical protein [Aliiglaciecola sp. 3_MG-2023]